MSLLVSVLSIALIVVILGDGFETMIMPRRVTRPYRLSRLFYFMTWRPFRTLVFRIQSPKRRAALLSLFGPLSLLLLFAVWAIGMIVAFGGLQWSLGGGMHTDLPANFFTTLYLSGVTFLTLGFGDVTPSGPAGQLIAVAEAGVGFGVIAMVISYLPTLWQAFSEREVPIGLLDARAGSPPSAGQLLVRIMNHGSDSQLDDLLREWEVWAAKTLESHLSFPVLIYYRSQHDNQSWLAAITAILDTTALLIACAREREPYQA